MPLLIGIIGYKQSGKDTVCEMIRKILSHRKIERIAFADALKEEVSEATKQPIEFINNN